MLLFAQSLPCMMIHLQPSNTVQDGKQLFYRQLELTMEEAYTDAGQEMSMKMCQAEARAGFIAFLKKETPPWKCE